MAGSGRSSRGSGRASRRSPEKDGKAGPALHERVAQRLAAWVRPGDRLAVGLSGGLDSVALLDCVARAARRLRVRVAALHVDHGLSPRSARWAAFCRRLCRARGVPFRAVKVSVAPGASVEAAARAARYAVYAAAPAEFVLLAHHQDDQVETFLLQLLRGAGVRGLAAMPSVRPAAAGGARRPPARILRPFLDEPRAEILAYARSRGLRWIEDESNRDLAIRRNFLRREVLPRLAQRFPGYRTAIARAARHLSEAAALLDELAQGDAAGFLDGETLAVEALRRLAPARARNLLRYFLARCGLPMPPAERLEEALRQALEARGDARVRVDLGGASLRRFGGRLYVVRAAPAAPQGFARRWRGEREIALPELGGVLEMRRTRGKGLSLVRLRGAPVTVRVRAGGERLRPDPRRPRRTLKNLLHERGVPPWERERLPLLFHGERLAWAAGVGADCTYSAQPGELGVEPCWRPLA
jgi:tRNA(Ile)-lysidine synthase